MTSNEDRLRNLAEGKPWELVASAQMLSSFRQLETLLRRLEGDTGFAGESDVSAAESFAAARKNMTALIDYLERTDRLIERSNGYREQAQAALANLGNGGLTDEQTAMVRGAAAGSTLVFGPVSILVNNASAWRVDSFAPGDDGPSGRRRACARPRA